MPMAPPRQERLVSLDVFRGIAITAMILVNTPGDWSVAFAPLQHAPWHGWTLTDLIFPFFLFIVGVSMAFSLSNHHRSEHRWWWVYLRVGRRTVILFGLGLFLNVLEHLPWWPTLSTLRIPGILQRIAIVYGVTSILVLHLSPRQQAYVAAGWLLLYWAVMTLVPVPGYGPGVLTPEGNLAAYIDSLLLHGHLLQGTWDPEGLLSTIPALATTLFGVLAGRWLGIAHDAYEKVAGLFVMGSVGMVLGIAWDQVFPINKQLWTSSYVVFTTGIALSALACCYWVIDLKGYRRIATPFVVFGMNAIMVYTLSGVLDRLLAWWSLGQPDGSRVSLRTWLYVHGFASWAGQWWGAAYASFLYAFTYVLLWLGLMWILYAKKIFINV
jgi:predicted acyltransferase